MSLLTLFNAPAGGGGGGWALAQAPTTARDSTGSNFPPLAYASSVTAGNLLVVVLAQYVGNPAITGSLNGAFTQGPNLNVGTSQLITTWYKVATTSGTETINFGGDTYNCAVAMLEFSGNSATPFDQQGTANSKTVTASASNSAAGDLVIAASGGNQFFNNYGFIADPAYTTLYTQNDSYPYAGLIVAYKTESGTGPSTSTISTDAGTADSNVNSVILTFKAAPASGVTGTAAWTESDDAAAITGALTASGSAAWTEANDTASLTGTVGTSVTGSAAWTEANDTPAITGAAQVSGTSAWTEANDAASAAGSVLASGSAAWTEANDAASITGTVGTLSVSGALAWIEADDAWQLTGTSDATVGRTPGGSGGGGKQGKQKKYNYDFSPAPVAGKSVAEVVKATVAKVDKQPLTAMSAALMRLEATLPDLTVIQIELEQEQRLAAEAQQAMQLAQDDEDEAIATLMAMLL